MNRKKLTMKFLIKMKYVSFISEIKDIKPKIFTPDRREPIHKILLKMNKQKLLITS